MQLLKKANHRLNNWKYTFHSSLYIKKMERNTEKHLPAGEVWTFSNVNMKAQKMSAEIMLL